MLSREITAELLDCLKVVQDTLKGNSALGRDQLKNMADIFQASADICNEVLMAQEEMIVSNKLIANDE